MAGVSRATISEMVKRENLVLNSASRLDTDNVKNAEYLATRRRKIDASSIPANAQTLPAVVPAVVLAQKPVSDISSVPNPSEDETARVAGIPKTLLGLTVRDLVVRYGNLNNVERYVRILRDLTTADEKDQRIQERRLMLVERDFVIARVFTFLDVLSGRLIDVPDAIIDELISIVLSAQDGSRVKAIALLRSSIERTLADAKGTIINEMTALRAKYQVDPLADIREKIEEMGA